MPQAVTRRIPSAPNASPGRIRSPSTSLASRTVTAGYSAVITAARANGPQSTASTYSKLAATSPAPAASAMPDSPRLALGRTGR